MCNNPFYRFAVSEAVMKVLPPRYRKRVKNGGIFMDRKERDYFIERGVHPDCIVPIPCGKCFGCKNDYQAEWTTRAMCESTLHNSNLFVTLTYNDENINLTEIIHPLTGEIKNVGVVSKEDFTAFVKRLRGYVPPFRFLSCFEYGDTTKRPHCHFIGFGLELNDLTYFYSKDRFGKVSREPKIGSTNYYLSPLLSKVWGKGFVLVEEMTIENCSYVASYVNKKVSPKSVKLAQGSDKVLDRFCRQFDDYSKTIDNLVELGKIPSPCLHMSRMPGLGSGFIEDNLWHYYSYDRLPLIKGKKLPKNHIRFFDNLFIKKDLEFCLLALKKKRRKKNYVPYVFYGDNGVRERELREEKLRRAHERKKPRDL